jgi:hypothetical protein
MDSFYRSGRGAHHGGLAVAQIPPVGPTGSPAVTQPAACAKGWPSVNIPPCSLDRKQGGGPTGSRQGLPQQRSHLLLSGPGLLVSFLVPIPLDPLPLRPPAHLSSPRHHAACPLADLSCQFHVAHPDVASSGTPLKLGTWEPGRYPPVHQSVPEAICCPQAPSSLTHAHSVHHLLPSALSWAPASSSQPPLLCVLKVPRPRKAKAKEGQGIWTAAAAQALPQSPALLPVRLPYPRGTPTSFRHCSELSPCSGSPEWSTPASSCGASQVPLGSLEGRETWA